jgi:cadmium resistance protein CadD (predicted permease)
VNLSDFLSGLFLGILGYTSTNFDNLLLLGTLLSSDGDKRPIFHGFWLANAIVMVLAGLFALLQALLPPAALGWLGILPILLGVRILLQRRGTSEAPGARAASAVSIGLLLVANSTDTIAVFGALFAESERLVAVGLVLGFTLSELLWTRLMKRIAAAATESQRIARLARHLSPFIMIAIGIYVLADTTTDVI